MRYFKNTFIWIFILTLLVGYYYIDIKREKIQEKKKDEATRLFPFESNQVLKIQIKKTDSDIELERWEEGWRLIKPVQAPAVNEEVEKFLRYATDFRNDSNYVMDNDPTEERLIEFGLDKPEVAVTLFVGKEISPHTIFLGHRSPTKGVAFARLQGDPKVYRVLADVKAEADQDVYHFRDKRIVNYEPSMIDLMEVSSSSGTIRCELPMDGKWRIVAPVNAKADISRIMELLTFFKNQEIKEFIEEEPKDLVKYGLQHEAQKISFRISGDNAISSQIFFGDRDKKKRGIFARIGDKKNVVLLDDKLLDYIPAEPFSIMNKEIFSFEEEEVQKISVFSESTQWEFAKKPDFSWEQTAPLEKAMDFNPLMAFLQEIRKWRIQKFIPGNPDLFKSSGLDQPTYKVAISMKDAKEEEWIAMGKKSGEEGFYAMAGNGLDIFIIGNEAGQNIQYFLGEMK